MATSVSVSTRHDQLQAVHARYRAGTKDEKLRILIWDQQKAVARSTSGSAPTRIGCITTDHAVHAQCGQCRERLFRILHRLPQPRRAAVAGQPEHVRHVWTQPRAGVLRG